MRVLDKNKRTVYYSLYQGKTEATDSYGNRTGEYVNSYSAPAKAQMNIGTARNDSDLAPFGIDVQYDYSIVTDDLETAWDTTTIFWVDGAVPDSDGEDGAIRHNAKVVRVARSINFVTLALQGVDVT